MFLIQTLSFLSREPLQVKYLCSSPNYYYKVLSASWEKASMSTSLDLWTLVDSDQE